MSTLPNDHIRPVDQSVLDTLRRFGSDLAGCGALEQNSGKNGSRPVGLTVQELTEHLEVTPTAVRQRLERLIELDLIARQKESVGRGRPLYRYCLTQMGTRYAAASYADLASAMWQELMLLPNPNLRNRILRRVAKRLGEGLRESCHDLHDLRDRLSATARELNRRKVEATVEERSNTPVLEVHSCPYPEIAAQEDGRHLCEMEQEMLSDALGQSVQLDCCRLDGHDCCQFRPVEISAAPK